MALRSWEWGRGIDIDADGGVVGSGFLFRLEPPRWLRAWARRQLPSPTKEKAPFRADISDVVLVSLLMDPNILNPIVIVKVVSEPDK